MKYASLVPVMLFVLLAVVRSTTAQESTGAKTRLATMRAVIERFTGESDHIKADAGLRFREKPLLRYSDATRGLMDDSTLHDASVWRLGTSGRPTALVTLEIYRAAGKEAQLSYEFISLAEQPFALSLPADEKIAWKATGTELQWRAVAAAPSPAKTVIECRLLAQPIDRYDDKDADIVDGAIFVYANGTNPEACVVVECTDKEWSYGTLRMGAAKLSIELDGRQVARYPFFGEYGRRDGKYTSMSQPIDLP